MFIGNISNLVDLLSARTFSEASTKLSDHERNSEALSISCSLANSLLMPLRALFSVGNLWLSSNALISAQLAAVSMIVENVFGRSNIGTRRDTEANWEDHTGEDSDLVWERNRFEPHLLVGVVRLVLGEESLIKRSELRLVEVTWNEKIWVLSRVAREGFVDGIISDDVRVVSETSRSVVPVSFECV